MSRKRQRWHAAIARPQPRPNRLHADPVPRSLIAQHGTPSPGGHPRSVGAASHDVRPRSSDRQHTRAFAKRRLQRNLLIACQDHLTRDKFLKRDLRPRTNTLARDPRDTHARPRNRIQRHIRRARSALHQRPHARRSLLRAHVHQLYRRARTPRQHAMIVRQPTLRLGSSRI